MAKATMSNVIDRLRRALLAGGDVDLTDGELLELFVNRRDEAAVAALVRRYGTMVWSVCRRILRNHHDAEDAFQATFLVLVRKGSSVRPREMLAAWLHGVARQTALKARATTAKRQGREKQVMAMPEPQAPRHEESWSDLQPLLDQELARLHDKYRVAILLCELEGKSRKEAARQLGIPEGTLSSRLTTARRMLAKRLARHGLAHSAGGLALLLSQKVDASVPSSLISATIKAASLVAAGKSVVAGAVSAKVAALTEVVVKAMLLSKLKTLVMLLGTLGVMTLTLGFAAYHGFAQQSASETARAQVRKPDARKDLPAMPHLDRNGDALPPGAITRLGSARFRNSDRVVHLIYSPDGKVMAAACWDGSVRLWDASTGKLRWHLETDKENGPGRTPFPQSIQHVLAFSSDGKDLAMLNRSGYTVLNTDAARVVVRHDWPALYDAKQDAESFAIAPDLTTFAVKFFDGSVQIHDSVSGQQKWRFMTELKAFPQKMTFSADGKALYVLAYRGQKRLVTAYDATSGRVVDTWNADGQIENMALSRDSRHLVVVGSRVFLWDLKSGKERHEIKLPVPFAHAAAFSPEGNTLAVTNGWDVLFFDTATRNQQRRMRLLSGAMSLAFSPDGNTLAAGEQCITQWKIATGELQAPIPEPGGAILRVQFQAGGNQLLAIGTQGASLWDVAGGQRVPLAALNEQLKPSLPLYWGSVSQNGRRLVVRGSADDLVLIDTATNQPLRTFKGRKEYGKSVVLSPDGTRLYSADYKRVIVWDVASGKTLRELESKFVSQVAISPDGRWLASWANGKYTPKPALGDYDVRVWDVTTGELGTV